MHWPLNKLHFIIFHCFVIGSSTHVDTAWAVVFHFVAWFFLCQMRGRLWSCQWMFVGLLMFQFVLDTCRVFERLALFPQPQNALLPHEPRVKFSITLHLWKPATISIHIYHQTGLSNWKWNMKLVYALLESTYDLINKCRRYFVNKVNIVKAS
jgi:hypothetical protein